MRSLIAALLVLLVLAPSLARAQQSTRTRDVGFSWDARGRELRMELAFRDALTPELERKLQRGLPTTIVFSALIRSAATKAIVATTGQTCRVVWHVWDELYIVELTRPGERRVMQTLTTEGVLRRCLEIKSRYFDGRLLVGRRGPIPFGQSLFADVLVQVNPVSPEVLAKVARWLSRSSGAPDPGDALFSTFTGLFRKRVSDSDRELRFTTRVRWPTVEKPSATQKR